MLSKILKKYADSYIEVNNKKIYLHESYAYLKNKIKTNKSKYIFLTKITLFGYKSISVRKRSITKYGRIDNGKIVSSCLLYE